ncbi:protein WHAT'S THIS FACTOR 1 homolog, chloroplastic-like [Phragmites australis]|uniref:protein WHAT'S THIS FACTOR 1 homolog, chloroplastic-like n=1 Tax=Phragmites australis TaxID=29695 RepID=UPI002D769D94|nr:protein WHAT'S THIS FACTOR 1 homolog, chloroplastic-like [Phragmites australis]
MDAKLMLLPFPSAPAPLHPAAPARSLFLGASLPLHPCAPPPFLLRLRPRPAVVVAQAAVKRRKEVPFDNVIQRDKKLKLVLKLRNILVAQPDRVMSLRDLGRFRRDLGLTRKRRLIALLKRFPGVFEVIEEGVYSLKFRLTPAAERLYLDELHLKNESEGLAVTKLRKLLMMSLDRRILIEKIAHLKHDLALPPEFRDTICLRYPQYFRVVRMDRGPGLELTHWDPELAVSAAELAEEENRAREAEERNLIIDRPLKFNRVKLPKGLKLTRGEARRIAQFKEMPYISPYSDFSHLRPGSAEKEKHACGVVHEILSLTLEKRTLVDHLTHFREEFRFSQSLRGMLIRHPDMFYVSFKGDRDSVFLREAYRDSQLVEKNKLVLIKEKMRALVAVPRFLRRGAVRTSEAAKGANGAAQLLNEGSDTEDDEDEGLSDMEDLISELSGGKSDTDYQWGDGWFGENDDSPPDFEDDDSSPQEVKVTMKNADGSANRRVSVPVFPDGRPRERW